MSQHPSAAGNNPSLPGVRPAFATIEDFKIISGLSRRVIYELLGDGALRAVKRGVTTLVDVEHGLAFLRSLPPARVKPSRRKAEEAAAS